MNEIKLPPLPRPDAEFGTHSRKQIRAYTIAAIEADRQARGGDQTEQKQPETRVNTGSGGGDQRAAFEAWYDSYDMRTPQSPFGRWLSRKAWDAAMQSPEVQALYEALREVVDAADGKGWGQLDPGLEKQRAALAVMEKQK